MATQYGGTIRWVFEADDTQFTNKINEASRNAESLKEVVKDTDETVQKTVSNTTRAVGEQADSVGSLFSALGNGLKNMGLGAFTVGATAATGALTKLAKKGIAATNFLEVSQTAMSGLLGSMEAGNKAMSIAADFWSNNPFQRDVVTRATQQLVQYGRQLGNLNDDLYTLKPIAMSSSASLDELATLYGRAAAAGRVMTQDIEVLSYRGVPIYRELAKALGTTEAGVRDFASQGKISFTIFQNALKNAVNDDALAQFEQTLDRAQDKLSGSISTLAGYLGGYEIVNNQLKISSDGLYRSWVQLLRTVAGAGSDNEGLGSGLRTKSLQEGLKNIGDALAKVVDFINSAAKPAFKVLGDLVGFIGNNTEFLVPILGGLLVVYGNLASKIPIVNQLFGKWSSSISGIGKAIQGLAKSHPVLTAILAIFAVGLVSAMKNSEKFRAAVGKILSSIGKIIEAIMPILNAFVDVFVNILSSPAIISTIEFIAEAIAGVANAIASLPVEVIQLLTVAILGFIAANKMNPWIVFATGVAMAIAAISDFLNAIGGIQNVPKEIVKFFAGLPQALAEIGGNMVAGLVNGWNEAWGWATQAIGNMIGGLVESIKGLLGIHSPSTVMASVGKNMTLGLAEGITNSKSVAQRAMENLANDTLSIAQKVIKNKLDFDVIDVNGQYKAWKKVAKLFTQGSDQYKEAIEQMEDARKSVNLQIIKLQNEYNSALDESISKVKNFYGLFTQVSTKGGMDSSQILSNLDKQVAELQGWAAAQETISGLDLDKDFIAELKTMGIDASNELQSIANMTESELDTLNTLWKQKSELATTSATEQMTTIKESTLEQIAQLKDGIDGETIDVREVGGKLVSEIGDGITDALPTLESAYAKLGDYMKQAAKQISSSGSKKTTTATPKIDNPFDTTSSTASDLKEQIEKSAEGLGTTLGIAGVGLMGVGLVKGIATWKKNKQQSQVMEKLSQVLSGDGGVLNGANNALSKLGGTNISSSAGTVSENIQSIGNVTETIGETGTKMNKYEQVLKDIALTLAVVIEAAIALAAVAGAIWVMNQAIPDDIGIVIPKLAVVGIAIAGMGALAYVGSLAWKEIAKGLLLVLGVAIDLALVALALGEVDKNIPENIGEMYAKLGVVATAIIGMGALSAVAGILWEVIGVGLLAMLGISGNIALAAKAVGEIDKNIPDDTSKMPDKIGAMALAVLAFEGLSAIAGIGFVAIGLGLDGLNGITDQIIKTARALAFVNFAIPDDYGNLENKIKVMSSIIKYIAGESFGGFLENLKQEWNMKPLANTMQMFAQCAGYVSEIAKVNFNPSEVNSKIDALTAVINHLAGEEIKGHKGGFLGFVDGLFSGKDSYETAAAKAAVSMEALGKIAKVIMNDFPKGDIDVKSVKRTIESLSRIIELVHTEFPTDSEMEVRAETVYYAEGLVHNLKEFIESADKLPTKLENYDSICDILEQSGWIVGDAIKNNFPNDNEMENRGITVNHARNLVDRVREFIFSVNFMPSFIDYNSSYDTIEWGWQILSALSENMNVDEGMENRGITVDNARNLLDRLREFVDSANKIKGGANVENVSKAIESFKAIAKQLADVFVSSKQQFESVGAQIIDSLIKGVSSKNGDVSNAGNQIVLTFGERLFQESPNLKKPGTQLGQDVIGGIESVYGKFTETGKNVGNKLMDGFRQVDYKKSGQYAVDGFVNGLLSKNAILTKAGREMANIFLKAFKKQAGEGSPWKTTYQSGQFAGEGLINGLASMQEDIISEAEIIADGVVNALDMSDATITPGVSLSGAAPMVSMDDGVAFGSRSGSVIIEQTNNNYTQYDIEQVNRDLSWELSKV